MATTIKLKNGSGAPLAGDLVQGEPAFDLTNKRLYTEDSGGTVIEVGTNPGTDVTFADNRKAIFGAGSDLQIFHDPSGPSSVISDQGAGDLILRGSNQIRFQDATGAEHYAIFNENGAVQLYYDNAVKLETTSTGIDVTGDVNSDSVTTGTFTSTGIDDNATSTAITIDSSENVGIGTSSPDASLTVKPQSSAVGTHVNQNWSYDSTSSGTEFDLKLKQVVSSNLVKYTFDLRNSGTSYDNNLVLDRGNVGIGTSSPDQLLDVGDHTATGNRSIRISQRTATAAQTYGGIEFFYDNSAGTTGVNAAIKYAAGPLRNDGELTFHTGASASISERLRIDHNGNVGIGTTSPSEKLNVSGNVRVTSGFVSFSGSISTPSEAAAVYRPADNTLAFSTANTERMRIDSSGNVGVGTTSPADELHINNDSANVNLRLTRNTATGARISGSDGALTPAIIFETIASSAITERMRIDSDGRIGVGTSNPDSDISYGLDLNGLVVARYDVSGGVPTTSAGLGGVFSASANGGGFYSGDLILQSRPAVNSRSIRFFTGNTTAERMTIDAAGAVNIVGSLSKGSGSFKIDHPLPSKTDTHHLVHSFVEGPQADNLYRGTVSLVEGSATVNLDTAGGMSEGTFVCLNTNVQCFTSNESGWTAVKGSVSGNVLTITAQETCEDVVSWMVVGERCDQHMLDTEWTDENGRVIVEPLKGA